MESTGRYNLQMRKVDTWTVLKKRSGYNCHGGR